MSDEREMWVVEVWRPGDEWRVDMPYLAFKDAYDEAEALGDSSPYKKYRAVRYAPVDALSQARLDGERHGIERAARVADEVAAANATDINNLDEHLCAMGIAGAIRTLVVGGGGKGEGK